jgi:CheY-like chemotaxis protein
LVKITSNKHYHSQLNIIPINKCHIAGKTKDDLYIRFSSNLFNSSMNPGILQGKRILVADDNVVNQVVMRHSLTALGCKAEFVSDGLQAIENLKSNSFDAILMDIQMPLMDGLEATKHIRQVMQNTVPIIAVSAHSFGQERQESASAGMNSYLLKPFTIQQLQETLMQSIS